MSQAILISNNEVINCLYELNLKAYVAVDVIVKEDLKSTTQLLKLASNIDVIIVFKDYILKSDEVEEFKDFLSTNKLEIPIILLGEQEASFDNKMLISNKYDIKGLLMGMAKVLEVTAEQMASREVAPYFPIPIRIFKILNKSHCDIYRRKKIEDFNFEYTKVIQKEETLNSNAQSSLKNFLKEGVTHLYIDSVERLRFINKTSGFIVNELHRENLTESEKIEVISQGMNMVAEELFESERVSSAVAEVSEACVKAVNEVIRDVPKLKNLLGMLMENKSNFVFKHGVLASYISGEIIKNISWGSSEQIEKVAFALYFHDIYLIPIFKKYPNYFCEEELLNSDEVSEQDKKIINCHAQLAGQMIKTFPRAPMGADMIITQHHGMMGGVGFAQTYKDDISLLSKIIVIAEDISSKMIEEISLNIDEDATDTQRIAKRLYEKYTYSSYRKIIGAFEKVTFEKPTA